MAASGRTAAFPHANGLVRVFRAIYRSVMTISPDKLDAAIAHSLARSPFKGKQRDPERIERMLDLLREVWTKQPDTRLLQLLLNVAPTGPQPVPQLYNLEDGTLERLLRARYAPDAPAPDEPEEAASPAP